MNSAGIVDGEIAYLIKDFNRLEFDAERWMECVKKVYGYLKALKVVYPLLDLVRLSVIDPLRRTTLLNENSYLTTPIYSMI